VSNESIFEGETWGVEVACTQSHRISNLRSAAC
jgi:hypothetical protein